MQLHIDGTQPVRPGEELNTGALEVFLSRHFDNVTIPIQIEQFSGGSSNLTYLVRMGQQSVVLRRPPYGNQVKSAHDMGREYRVLSKLSLVYAPAPRPFVYCDDETILGAPFYLMELRRGIILKQPLPPTLSLDPKTVRQLSEAFIDNLVRLHSVDYKAAGLEDLGKPVGYAQRQIEGWTKRFANAQTEVIPEMNQLIVWLNERIPDEIGATLVHNDYKYDNLILDPHDLTKITGVLDWEMCTVGDPLMDLGTSLGYWVETSDHEAMKSSARGPTTLPGSLTRRELVDRYSDITRRDVSNMLFYYCFGLFKIAVIIQQIYARFFRGHTQDARFANLNHQVAILCRAAIMAIEADRF